MPVKGGYLALAAGGGLLIWSGLKGKNWSQVLRTIMNGRKPETTLTAYGITGGSAADSAAGVAAHAGGSATGNAIAQDAVGYVGAGYVWGGTPARGVGNWDCSSFANWVIGHDMGLAIPTYGPGTYTGASHGPVTGVWLVWSGAFTIHRQDAQAGDLAVWQTHMGILTGPDTMVSALNSSIGTKETSIEGGSPPGEVLFIRRLKAVTPGG